MFMLFIFSLLQATTGLRRQRHRRCQADLHTQTQSHGKPFYPNYDKHKIKETMNPNLILTNNGHFKI